MLNRVGGETRQEAPKPVTLPKFVFTEIDDVDREIEAAATKVAEQRAIRRGLDAWQLVQKSEWSFAGWCAIGAALAVGKAHALRITGSNRAWGRNYSRAFCDWMREHNFDRMPKSTRSVALELVENLPAIEAWRTTLTEKQRRKRIHPLSNVAAWKKATAQNKSKRADDQVKAAAAAWTRFKCLMEKLSPDQAAPLWQQAEAQAALAIRGI